MSRLDAMVARPGKDGKTYWTRIGTFWPAKDGKPGGQVVLDALPIPDKEGRVSISLFEPRERDGGKPTGGAPSRGNSDLMDEVPF